MPISQEMSGGFSSGNKPAFQASFVRHAHEILKMGYYRLDAKKHASSEEEEITGELVRSMKNVLQDRHAPRWAKFFWATEESRVSDPVRTGKRRLRIDIEILKIQQGPRPQFLFEAKRLRNAKSQRNYLGDEGLCCFLDGRYAKEYPVAGMLGYVQCGSIDSHAAALEFKLAEDGTRFAVEEDGQWKVCETAKELASFRTKHRRKGKLAQITIIHTLLAFC